LLVNGNGTGNGHGNGTGNGNIERTSHLNIWPSAIGPLTLSLGSLWSLWSLPSPPAASRPDLL
jgi:hypothetical protein